MEASISQLPDTRVPISPAYAMAGLRVVRLYDFEEAVPLPAAEREAYRRRFATLFVDDSHTRTGGIGQVVFALNAQGESLALKTLRPGELDEVSIKREEQAFRSEYEAHLTLNGVRGFPRLYGFGHLGDAPAIVMEWVRGITLREARASLAADVEGRVPTLTVARLGRSLFELLVRMGQMGTGLVHRDLSPANVMVRTDHLSLEEQVREGAFDLCLVDLGSAEEAGHGDDTSLTAVAGIMRGATADYAPPEMLTRDLPNLARLRRSPKIDVYAAGSILYELMAGRLPLDLGATDRSPYRIKTDERPERPLGIHEATDDLERTLAAEPEVATEVAVGLLDLPERPSADDIRRCLVTVDGQLADIIMSCLTPSQDDRPTAEEVRSALATFCSCHAENVRRALAGEQLLPCTGDASWYAGVSPLALRRTIRHVGTAVACGVWIVVVVATALLVEGTGAELASSGITLSAPIVAAVLALPGLLGLAVRGRDAGGRAGFLRGTFMLTCCSLIDASLTTQLTFDTPARANGLLAAVFASWAAGWCPLVLSYATASGPGIARRRRRSLPSPQTELAPNPGTTVAASASPPATPDDHTDDVTYEVPDHDNAL